MAIRFKAVQRVNPSDQNAARKFYARATTKEVKGLLDLADIMSDGGTIRRSDIYAVLISLVSAITREIKSGNRVNMGELGTFYPSINSEGYETAEEVSANGIKKVNLRYRPAKEMKKVLRTLDFQKIGDAASGTDPGGASPDPSAGS